MLNIRKWRQRYQCHGLESPKITFTIVYISYISVTSLTPMLLNKIHTGKLLILTDSLEWSLNEFYGPLANRGISWPFLNLEANYHVYRILPSNIFVKKLNHVHTFALCLSKVKSNTAK
jgi:hypothetical protein